MKCGCTILTSPLLTLEFRSAGSFVDRACLLLLCRRCAGHFREVLEKLRQKRPAASAEFCWCVLLPKYESGASFNLIMPEQFAEGGYGDLLIRGAAAAALVFHSLPLTWRLASRADFSCVCGVDEDAQGFAASCWFWRWQTALSIWPKKADLGKAKNCIASLFCVEYFTIIMTKEK